MNYIDAIENLSVALTSVGFDFPHVWQTGFFVMANQPKDGRASFAETWELSPLSPHRKARNKKPKVWLPKSCPIEPMDIPNLIENRLVDLEIKAGFAEDLLDQLNAQVYRQQQQIDALLQALHYLREQSPEPGGGGEVRNLRDDIPPHF